MPAIELLSLAKDYGGKRALDGISLEVAPGEVFGYLGPNGAGKTTTIKLLTGLIKPTSGDARVCGFSVMESPLEVKARVGYLPESGALFEKLSAREYLGFIGTLYGLDPARSAAAATRWLGDFGLASRQDDRLGSYSRGMRQKVCFAAALLHDPPVLVLDEPLTGLDVEGVSRIKGLLRELAAGGRTVFYSSHLIDVVERVCTKVAVIQQGRILATGTVEEVKTLAGKASLEEALLGLWGRAPG